MLCVVTGIGFLITVFSAGYMKGEEGYFRFFAYLGLFIFSMTCLVMGNNFIMLYLGWEGVGLCSYLLIGYYYEQPSAVEAAKKAFLVNRIGDFGFGLGIMLIFLTFGTVSYFGAGVGTHTGVLELATLPLDQLQRIPNVNAAWVPTAMKWVPFLLMLGAFGKSAQFPLYVWLPDAMEGPTPVSALIHAATMVTAGVYMIARCGTLFVANARGDAHHRRHRRFHRAAGRHHRPAAIRSEKSLRLQHDQPARIHVRRRGMPGPRGGRVPSGHPRVLQGAAVPLLRRGHARHARRTGHAENVRPEKSPAQDQLAAFSSAAWRWPAFRSFSGFFSKDEIVGAVVRCATRFWAWSCSSRLF